MNKHTVFFDGEYGMHVVGTYYSKEETCASVHQFLAERNYNPPYIRFWEQLGYGELDAAVTVLDVGSHTEFFVITPPIVAKEMDTDD